MTAFRYLLFVLILIGSGSTAAHAEKRLALIIGNSAYKSVARLSNPANDAKLVGDMLRNAGFERVDVKLDLGVQEMRRALREFGARAREAEVALIYYAGHGIELDGVNYLIPTDAALEADSDVLDEAIALDRVLFAIEPAKQLRLVVLDACRDNPFAKTMKRSVASRNIGRGLAKVEPPSPNTMIAFSAKAGSTAADGDASNSPFAAALVAHLPKPGLDLRRAFGFVRDDVLKATGYRQEPYVYGSLGGNDIALVPAAPAAAAATDPDAAMRRDYELAERIGSQAAFDAFLEKYPTGFYAALAKAQRAKLSTPVTAAPAARPADLRDKPADIARGPEPPAAEVTRSPPEPARVEKPPTPEPTVVAALPLPAEKPAAAVQPPDLPRLLVGELHRVGCSTADSDGASNGRWDGNARRALERFNKQAGTRFDVKVASLDALDAVKARTSRVCPLLCDKGQRAEGESCVAIACLAGQARDEDGDCVRRKDEPVARKQTEPAKREEPARKKEPAVAMRTEPEPKRVSGGGRCTSISQRCAIEIGGRCDAATGKWEYGRNGAGGNTMSFNNCIGRMMAGRR
ncbi:caspase family protein [Bradyrhizobium aeschynomenes]|uniref:caspase family protein n=1 Tax=Bradyrhizobium aeschynomenes TaxID=2734909 RepID=UPI00155486D5|nr:caspase family protein [Bradyrhizobium aeschynomenes]NPV19789.1 caspase family protein [Bradyrhizobium aeschynomenes]